MKKKILILIALAFFGCQSNSPTTNEVENSTVNQPGDKSGWEFEKCGENIVCLKEHGWEIRLVALEVVKKDILEPSNHPSFIEEAQEFLNSYTPDAELYFFKSPKITWESLAGREGYLILKNETVVSSISTSRS